MIEISKKSERGEKLHQLLNFCLWRRVVSKADVIEWGRVNYYISAERRVRDFVREKKMRRIDKTECVLRNLKGNMAYYEAV